jgi:FKBP-type peptidyl-prolyl cis-trans isomerase FkpA
MRSSIVQLGLVILLTTSCLKKENCAKLENRIVPAQEQLDLANYLKSNNIQATLHSSNLYYQVLEQGNGVVPTLCESIEVAYVGKLTNGFIFDRNTDAFFSFNGLIEGWKIGIPLIKTGGTIRLFIPPTLGYGSNALEGIPQNSILIFDIILKGVQ